MSHFSSKVGVKNKDKIQGWQGTWDLDDKLLERREL